MVYSVLLCYVDTRVRLSAEIKNKLWAHTPPDYGSVFPCFAIARCFRALRGVSSSSLVDTFTGRATAIRIY